MTSPVSIDRPRWLVWVTLGSILAPPPSALWRLGLATGLSMGPPSPTGGAGAGSPRTIGVLRASGFQAGKVQRNASIGFPIPGRASRCWWPPRHRPRWPPPHGQPARPRGSASGGPNGSPTDRRRSRTARGRPRIRRPAGGPGPAAAGGRHGNRRR
jgi:hypothetical protein